MQTPNRDNAYLLTQVTHCCGIVSVQTAQYGSVQTVVVATQVPAVVTANPILQAVQNIRFGQIAQFGTATQVKAIGVQIPVAGCKKKFGRQVMQVCGLSGKHTAQAISVQVKTVATQVPATVKTKFGLQVKQTVNETGQLAQLATAQTDGKVETQIPIRDLENPVLQVTQI